MTLAYPKPTRKERIKRRMSRRPAPVQKHSKPQAWRSPDYRAYVRMHNCVGCGVNWEEEYVAAAHFGGHGLSTKAPDWNTLPLCGNCHDIQGSMTIYAFQDLYKINAFEVAFTLLTQWLEQRWREAEVGD